MADEHGARNGSTGDAERLRRAEASMVSGIGRAQGMFDRLSWIVWGIVVLLVGGLAVMFLLPRGIGH